MPKAVRKADKLEGSLCYAASPSGTTCVNPDFSSPGTYLIIKGNLFVNNQTHESLNYDVTIKFGTGTDMTGTLIISADMTARYSMWVK